MPDEWQCPWSMCDAFMVRCHDIPAFLGRSGYRSPRPIQVSLTDRQRLCRDVQSWAREQHLKVSVLLIRLVRGAGECVATGVPVPLQAPVRPLPHSGSDLQNRFTGSTRHTTTREEG